MSSVKSKGAVTNLRLYQHIVKEDMWKGMKDLTNCDLVV